MRQCTGIGVCYQHRLFGQLDHVHHRLLADVAEVDSDAQLVHDAYSISSEQSEAGFFRLQAAIAEGVPVIVRQLHDAQAEAAEEVKPVEFVGDRSGVLPAHDQADLVLGLGTIEVGNRLELQPW